MEGFLSVVLEIFRVFFRGIWLFVIFIAVAIYHAIMLPFRKIKEGQNKSSR